ncbi:LOW QUALITY PROTEIN: adiponectin receptor protein 1-like [Molossus nigricans]
METWLPTRTPLRSDPVTACSGVLRLLPATRLKSSCFFGLSLQQTFDSCLRQVVADSAVDEEEDEKEARKSRECGPWHFLSALSKQFAGSTAAAESCPARLPSQGDLCPLGTQPFPKLKLPGIEVPARGLLTKDLWWHRALGLLPITETDTVELAELGPLLEEKTKRGIADPPKAEEEQACPGPQEEEEEVPVVTLALRAHHAMEKMEEFVYKAWEGCWRVILYDVLPELKDNLLHGLRPPMPSFRACFKSIFHIHTETGNIWTHLLGFMLFLFLGILTMLRPNMYFMAPLQEKGFGMFFLGAVLCLSFSWLFRTVYCHSEKVSRTFSKLDCSGIALVILGSFVPWLYYSFYRSPQLRLIYLSIICVLGICAIMVAQWDGFAPPKHRQTRAGVFLGLGLSGVVPTVHFTIAEGFVKATTVGQMGWFFLMAVMYITGAGLWAARIPERFFPGKFDIWFQSHQLFHVLVVAAAFVHFYGVSNLQEVCYSLEGGCTDDSPP